jgi:hypothetical protein
MFIIGNLAFWFDEKWLSRELYRDCLKEMKDKHGLDLCGLTS